MLDVKPPRQSASRPPWSHDPEPVEVEPLGAVIWAGRQWLATSYGIEARDGRYAIAAENLLRLDAGFGWIRHMASKGWVDMADFTAAYGVFHLFHGGRNREAAEIFKTFATRHGVPGYDRPRGRPGTLWSL